MTVYRFAAVAVALNSLLTTSSAQTTTSNVTAVISLQPTGNSIPGDFFGISSNWINFPDYCGNGSANHPGQTWFVPLLQNMRPCANCAGPSIRINGDGQAPYWGPAWPGKPPNEWGTNADYNVSAAAVDALAAAIQRLNGTFIVGLPFQVFSPNFKVSPYNATLAVQMAMGATGVVAGRVPMKFEIGNEPDWDGVRADFYSNEYEWEGFWRAYVTNLTAAGVPAASVIGGVWASCGWCVNASGYLARQAGLMGEFNVHLYLLMRGAKPSMADMLDDAAAAGGLQAHGYAAAAAAARAAGVRFTSRESNNINGGGISGVSDRFGAALWALDIALAFAAVGGSSWVPNMGTDCFNYSATGTGYNPFCAAVDPASPVSAGPPVVRGEYYGMVAAARAALGDGGGGAALLNVTLAADSDPRVTVYALLRAASTWDGLGPAATRGVLVLVLVNKNLVSMPGQKVPAPANDTAVALCLPSMPPPADAAPAAPAAAAPFLERLAAAGGAGAVTGIALAGQTFDGSADGAMRGAVVREPFEPTPSSALCSGTDVAYVVNLPAESAAVAYVPL